MLIIVPEHSPLHHRSSIIDANDLCDGLLTLLYTRFISEARSDRWSAHVDSVKCFCILQKLSLPLMCTFLEGQHVMLRMTCSAYSAWHLALKTSRMLKQKCHSEYHLWKLSKEDIVVPCRFLSSSLLSSLTSVCHALNTSRIRTDVNIRFHFTHCFSESHWFDKYSTSFQE